MFDTVASWSSEAVRFVRMLIALLSKVVEWLTSAQGYATNCVEVVRLLRGDGGGSVAGIADVVGRALAASAAASGGR